MRLRHRLPAALLALVVSFAGTVVYAVSVGDVVNQVSEASYTDYLNNHLYAHSGNSRYMAGSQHDLARTEIYNAFSSFGLTTSLNPFIYNLATYNNVVGVLPGKGHPEQIYIIGAHYDSANATCPGADDNASGVAGVLEAARVLSNYQFDSTLVFIAFDREEQGLKGSYAYAEAHKTDNIRGMISMDMIAYNPSTYHNQAYLCVTNVTSPPSIVSSLSGALSQYGGITATMTHNYYSQSDHYPFSLKGFESVLLIERNAGSNPYYHGPLDSVDTAGFIDYAYATDMTCGVVGYLATQAVLVPEPAALVLLLIGVFGLIAFARRKR